MTKREVWLLGRPKSPAELEEHERDVELALALLDGVHREDGPNGLPCVEFLSRETKPTEDEGRVALARVLLSENVPSLILWCLAGVFAPNGFRVPQCPLFSHGPRRAEFTNRSKGHANHARDLEIAYRVYTLREAGKTYVDACEEVATAAGFDDDRLVKRAYAKFDMEKMYGPLPKIRRSNNRRHKP